VFYKNVMNTTPVNFKGITRFGYDDEQSSNKRAAIRKRFNDDIFAANDVFINNPRLEEYELNKLIENIKRETLFRKNETSQIDGKIMEEIPLYNVHPLNGTSNYIGSTMDFTDEICQKLKQAGVKEVITFLEADFNEDVCKRNKLKYFSFPIKNDFWNGAQFQTRAAAKEKATIDYYVYYDIPYTENYKEDYINKQMKTWETNSRIFIDKFTDFINKMNKDNLYIGCACGTDRTNRALTLNSLFNPKAQNIKPFNSIVYYHKEAIKNLYENLTPNDKKKMGWDNKFDENFIPRLEKLTSKAGV